MIVSTTDFQAATKLLDRVPLRGGIQSSEYVRLDISKKGIFSLSLASDLIGHAEVPIQDPMPGRFFIERKLLFPWIRAACGKQIILTLKDQFLLLKEGRRQVTYANIPEIKGYAQAPPTQERDLHIDQSLFEDLRLAAKYAASDHLAPELNCIWLDQKTGTITATNQFSLYQAEVKTESTGPIPPAFPDLLDVAAKVTASDEGCRISYGRSYLFQLFSEKAISDFPLKRIHATMAEAKKWQTRLQVPGRALIDVLDRLGGYVAGSSSDETMISATAEEGKPVLTLATSALQGSFRESLKLPKPAQTSWTAEWLLPSLKPFLERLDPNDTLSLQWDDSTPYLFATKTRSLLSPRKVTAVKKK